MSFYLALAAAALFVGCVYPAPLELDTPDAGPSAWPRIISASPAEFAFPGVVHLERGDDRQIVLTIADEDIDDNLHVRFFVDYDNPDVSVRAECAASPSGERNRLANCRTASLCSSIDVGDTQPHILEAMVSDREFLNDSNPLAEGQPPFRAVPDNAAYSLRAWVMECAAE